jgi:hypothetical protein
VNWIEIYPGFTLPRNILAAQFPEYGDFDPDLPDPLELLRLPWTDPIPKWAWAAWSAAERLDKLPTMDPDLLQALAWKKYGSARYVYLVPAWRRYLTSIATDIDDIEDQLSTILWILELLGKKIIPVPPGVLRGGDAIRRALDDAQDVLNFSGVARSDKSLWREKQRKRRASVREARTRTAKLAQWLAANYGRLLEAAQATGTWFDFGIVLGPIFGYIDEGIWGLANKTLDNYLIAADTVLPGYREDFYANADRLTTDLYDTMASFYEGFIADQAFDDEAVNYFGF